jgi:hypothetical protein
VSFFGHLLKWIITDLSVLDPEPTEEDPTPARVKTYFMDLNTSAIIPAGKAKKVAVAASRYKRSAVRGGRRGRSAAAVPGVGAAATRQKQPGVPQYVMSKYLIAQLSTSLRKSNLAVALDFDIFIDAFIEFLNITNEKVIMKLGLDNLYFFTNSVALLLLSKM